METQGGAIGGAGAVARHATGAEQPVPLEVSPRPAQMNPTAAKIETGELPPEQSTFVNSRNQIEMVSPQAPPSAPSVSNLSPQ